MHNSLGIHSSLSDAGDPSFTSQHPPKTLKGSGGNFAESPQSASFGLQRQSQKWYPSRVGAGLRNLQLDSSLSLADASDSDRFQLQANHNQAEFALLERGGVSLDNFVQPESLLSLADASDSDRFQLQANHNQAEFAPSEQGGVSLDNFDFTWPISDNPFDGSFDHGAFE